MIIESRTFPQIYASLSSYEQADLRQRIQKLSLVSDSAIRNWYTGGRTPEPVHQANIAKALKSMGITSSPALLFPSK